MGELVGLIPFLKDAPAWMTVGVALLAILSVFLIRKKEVDVASMTSIGKLQLDQLAALMAQNTKLAEELGKLRDRMAETHQVMEDMRARILELEDLVREYKRKCDNCPGPGGMAQKITIYGDL